MKDSDVSVDKVKELLREEFSDNQACEDIVNKICEYCSSSDDEKRLEDRFDLLLEFALYYPNAISKNKNASPGIESLWKDKKALDARGEKEAQNI
jgi:hypothetical protein